MKLEPRIMANTETRSSTHQATHAFSGMLPFEDAKGGLGRGSCGHVCAACPMRGPVCASDSAGTLDRRPLR